MEGMSVSKPTGTNTGPARAVSAKPQWRHESGLTPEVCPHCFQGR